MNRFRFIFPYYRKYRSALILGFLCILPMQLLDLLIPFSLGRGINLILENPESGWETYLPGSLGPIVFLILGLAVAKGVLRFFMRRLITGVSRKVETDLKGDLFRHLNTLSYSFFNRSRTGDLIARATQDVEAVRFFTGPGMMYVGQSLLILPVAFTVMGLINWKLTVVVVIPLLIVTVAVKLISPRMTKYSDQIQESIGDISNLAQENFAGIRVVKGFHLERNEIEKFSRKCAEYKDQNLKMAYARASMNAAVYGLQDIALVLILGVGGLQIASGDFNTGQYFTFNYYVFMLFWPLIGLGWIVGMYHRAAAAARRIEEVFETRAEIADGNQSPTQPLRGDIEFRDVSFAHNGTKVLDGLNFKIRCGETIGVVGKTGSGKTTLATLVPRLYDPATGTITIGGQDIRQLPLHTLRRTIGFVPQDNFLFSDTLANNIGFGRESLESDAVIQAAESAKIANEIRSFSKGFDQLIGERGVTLSGGQKQRTSIARALAVDPDILILDDCLSSVDPETERELIGNLHGEAKERTAIIIAHRLSIVADCDRILVLQDGRISEQGTHGELLKQGGWYAETWKRQQIEKELEEL